MVTTWSNFDLTRPSTSVIGSVNTTPPLPYGNLEKKNDENDEFGNCICNKLITCYIYYENLTFIINFHNQYVSDEMKLLKTIPPRYRRQAATLIRQFENRGNELTWNSDGVIFIDQTSIPESDIFLLFPYLFKHKFPKTLLGFEDFLQKIEEMGLSHLILQKKFTKRSKYLKSESKMEKKDSTNWWFLD